LVYFVPLEISRKLKRGGYVTTIAKGCARKDTLKSSFAVSKKYIF